MPTMSEIGNAVSCVLPARHACACTDRPEPRANDGPSRRSGSAHHYILGANAVDETSGVACAIGYTKQMTIAFSQKQTFVQDAASVNLGSKPPFTAF